MPGSHRGSGGRARPAALLPLAAVVAVVTAATLAGTALTVRPTPRPAGAAGGVFPAADTTAAEATVRRFYEAANATIATGDVATLGAVLVPEFGGAEAGGGSPGRAALTGRLLALHAAAPEARLSVDEVTIAGHVALARVALRAGVGWAAGLAVGGSVGWGPVDVLRLAGGRVAAWQGTEAEAATVQPLARALLTPAAGPTVIGLTRLTFDPGRRVADAVLPGPVLLVAEGGTLRVRLGRVAARALAFGPGEGMALPAGETVEVGSAGPGSAAVLAVALFPPVPPDTLHDGLRPDGGDLRARALFLPDGGDGRPPQVWLPGVRALPLATGSTEAGGDQVGVALRRVSLGPGESLAPGVAAGPVLLAVELGGAVVPAAAWERSGREVVADPGRERGDGGAGLAVVEGEGAAARGGALGTLWAAEGEPLVALVADVGSAGAAETAVAETGAAATVRP